MKNELRIIAKVQEKYSCLEISTALICCTPVRRIRDWAHDLKLLNANEGAYPVFGKENSFLAV